MKATFKDGKKFLSEINSKDRVAIVCDNDLDGFSSGILFYKFAQSKGARVKSFVIDESKSPRRIVRKLRKFNKVIITDLGANKIPDVLEAVKDKDVFYTDHHPVDNVKVPKKILEYRTVDEGYIPSSRTAQELTETELWRGLAGTLSDMGNKYKENDKYIKNALKELGVKQDKFVEGVVYPLVDVIVYFNKNLQKAFDIILKADLKDLKSVSKYVDPIEEEIQMHKDKFENNREKLGKIEYYDFKPKYQVKGMVINGISSGSPNETFVFANPEGNKIKISARSQSGKVKVNELLIEATKGFEGAKAGGHPRASGAVIMKKDLKKFKENIAELTEKL